MSTFALKLFAIIVMLIDHIGAILFFSNKYADLYIVLRCIGRLAFPVFCFLIVEGYCYTKDVKKYLKRLGIFALISEIPYDAAFYYNHFGKDIITAIKSVYINGYNYKNLETLIYNLFSKQNVFFTLFLGLLLLYLMGLVEKKYEKNLIMSNIIDAVLTIGFCVLAYFVKADYGYGGILMIVAFYLFRSSKIMITICLFVINGSLLTKTHTGNIYDYIQLLATFAMLPIALYNGKKGKNIKYFFYIFYPAHLLLLFFIHQFIL